MTITERTLRKWRKEALQRLAYSDNHPNSTLSITSIRQMAERILRLTQELLDQHLLRK